MARKAIDVRSLAIVGARVRYEELWQEVDAVVKAFPELKAGTLAAAKAAGRKGGRRKMSEVERQAVSERMKSYWAARKK